MGVFETGEIKSPIDNANNKIVEIMYQGYKYWPAMKFIQFAFIPRDF